MFDWVGDAIDWIGDGISSLWDNTVGVVTSEAARVIFDMMFDWLFMLIYDGIAALFYAIDQSTADLFELGWIQAFVTLFYNIGWILFITGMVVAVFDTAIAYDSSSTAAILILCCLAEYFCNRPCRSNDTRKDSYTDECRTGCLRCVQV